MKDEGYLLIKMSMRWRTSHHNLNLFSNFSQNSTIIIFLFYVAIKRTLKELNIKIFTIRSKRSFFWFFHICRKHELQWNQVTINNITYLLLQDLVMWLYPPKGTETLVFCGKGARNSLNIWQTDHAMLLFNLIMEAFSNILFSLFPQGVPTPHWMQD